MAREVERVTAIPLVDQESSAQEWAQQEALGPGGYDWVDAAAAGHEVAQGVSVDVMGATREVSQAVSVAAAYFEDTLQVAPEVVLATGTTGAETLGSMIRESELEGLRVRELVDAAMLQAGVATAGVSRSWLAGVRGALRN
jgi:type IV pilus assembly protein PilM